MNATTKPNEAQHTPAAPWESAASPHALTVARKVLAKRGGHTEAHLCELELAVIVEAALSTDPNRAALVEAAQLVIDRWERGDLAEAVRSLSAALAAAKGAQ